MYLHFHVFAFSCICIFMYLHFHVFAFSCNRPTEHIYIYIQVVRSLTTCNCPVYFIIVISDV